LRAYGGGAVAVADDRRDVVPRDDDHPRRLVDCGLLVDWVSELAYTRGWHPRRLRRAQQTGTTSLVFRRRVVSTARSTTHTHANQFITTEIGLRMS